MKFLVCIVTLFLTACGFHPQGDMKLAPPLQKMYLQTPDPYGTLSRDLRNYLKMSHVRLVTSPEEAETILEILSDTSRQELLSVAGTQQTRQYNLMVNVNFAVSDKNGHTILPAQSLTENRTITVQANQILGSSNEATLYTQQMRRTLAYAIVNRLASIEVTKTINKAFAVQKKRSTQ